MLHTVELIKGNKLKDLTYAYIFKAKLYMLLYLIFENENGIALNYFNFFIHVSEYQKTFVDVGTLKKPFKDIYLK